jgi:DNA-binding MarR family transcriptional regulator
VQTESDFLVEEALRAQQRVGRCMRAATTPSWLQLDLTIAQVKGLLYVASAGRTSVGELARALGTGQPAASSLIERLVQDGLVGRTEDPGDRRRAIVQLTGRGEALVEQLEQAGREKWRHWLSQLPEGDLSALVQGLRALAELVERQAGFACVSETAGAEA